ncbi:MAG TPA: hypothetical protein VFQ35_06975 [Polyangiaceae bacterium]|nr:hypothetical protein [Polyangiaceae bacterium]
MKTRVDEVLLRQAQEFSLRFGCEACAHYEDELGGCSNGFPNAPHKAKRLELMSELEFCKQFELG